MTTLGDETALRRIAAYAAARNTDLATCAMGELLQVANAILAFSSMPTPLTGHLTIGEIERKHLVRVIGFALQALEAVPLAAATPGALPNVQAAALRSLVTYLLLPPHSRFHVQTPR